MLPSIYLYGNSRTVKKAYSSSPFTQCQKCWKYGHFKPVGKAESWICPLCSLQYTKADHCCPNPSCPSRGNLQAILNRCLASPARCSNCGEAHSPGSRDCPERPPLTSPCPALAPEASPGGLDPHHIDVQPDLPRKDPLPQFSQGSNNPPRSLPLLFQEETPRATRIPLAAPLLLLSLLRCRITAKSRPQDWALDTPFPLFNTTASGAGMCFPSCLILVHQQNIYLGLYGFRTLCSGEVGYLFSQALPYSRPRLPTATFRWPFTSSGH